MKNFADAFDAPQSSREHSFLRDEGWLAGTRITVRYHLGRLLNRNLFRESDSQVDRRLVAYIATRTSVDGATLISGFEHWQIGDTLLRYWFETEIDGKSKRKPREVAAIAAFLKNPAITLAELAREAGTTEKQLARMTQLNFALKIPARSRNRKEIEKKPLRRRRASSERP